MGFAAPASLERYWNTAMTAQAGFADNFDRVFGRVDTNGFPANNTLRSCKRGPKLSAKPAGAVIAVFRYLSRDAGAANPMEDLRGCLAYANGAMWSPIRRCLPFWSMTLLRWNTCHCPFSMSNGHQTKQAFAQPVDIFINNPTRESI